MGKPLTELNFDYGNYAAEMKKLQELSKEEIIASYRKKLTSKYRGVCRRDNKMKSRYGCRISDDTNKLNKMYLHVGYFDKVLMRFRSILVHTYLQTDYNCFTHL